MLLQLLQPLMDNIAGTTAASLDALCSQYLNYWRQAQLEPGIARQRSLQPTRFPDQSAEGNSTFLSTQQSIKIADLEDFIKRIEQQIKAINALQDQVCI